MAMERILSEIMNTSLLQWLEYIDC